MAITLGGFPVDLTCHAGGGITPGARWPLARRWLGRQLGCDAGAIRMGRTGMGKPYLLPPHGALSFSLSGRAGLLLLGCGRQGPVGVDIERIDPATPVLQVAAMSFHPAERDWLAALPAGPQLLAFHALWSVKEAVLKAAGCGIGSGLAFPRLAPPAFPLLLRVAGDPVWFGSGESKVAVACRSLPGGLPVETPVVIAAAHLMPGAGPDAARGMMIRPL